MRPLLLVFPYHLAVLALAELALAVLALAVLALSELALAELALAERLAVRLAVLAQVLMCQKNY